ncbi:MAG: hypothetical protein U5O39_02510 [Gammaproteobacteria bacterium]|nr:hypothetical protein [Gammaproteobacteria bacterium]
MTVFGGQTFFGMMDYVSNNIMLPLGGMFIAIFAAWILDKAVRDDELALNPFFDRIWRFLVGVAAPIGVGTVFVMTFL